jgi:hypothetical protein
VTSTHLRSTGRPTAGSNLVDVSDPAHPTFVHRYVYPTAIVSTYFGGRAKPWDLVAPPKFNSDYVYAIDNGDAEIVRIDKVTNQLQELPILLTTDLENAFGLAISSGRLYFALADEYSPKQLPFGAASTFGYVDLSSWTADAPPESGIIYTGLNPVSRGLGELQVDRRQPERSDRPQRLLGDGASHSMRSGSRQCTAQVTSTPSSRRNSALRRGPVGGSTAPLPDVG